MSASSIHLVRVITPDNEQRLWAAAAPREQAVDHVLTMLPAGASARLLDPRLKPHPDVVTGMRPGEVREL